MGEQKNCYKAGTPIPVVDTMRIGYPCINRTLGCRPDHTFRLASYSEQRLTETVKENLACLAGILRWNLANNLGFFRISSDIVPFASHPVCTSPWSEYFAEEFAAIGEIIRKGGMRISMHPDQFVVLNSQDTDVVERSIQELQYHARVLDLIGLDRTAKLQIHLGGVYGNRGNSLGRFIKNVGYLDETVRRRLVIENDERAYTVADCCTVSEHTGIPVVLDTFHHTCYNHGESLHDVFPLTSRTWKSSDGIPIVDYSSQHPGKRQGAHAESIDLPDFKRFLTASRPFDIDVMLEIKDKEKSALAALNAIRSDPRFTGR